MNVLIDIGHPAHVHLFSNFAREMQAKGNNIFFTCREKEFEVFLLKKYGFEYKSFGKKYKTAIGKVFGIIEFDLKEFFVGLKFKPDIIMSHGSIYAAHASFLLGKPHISMEDTFNFEQIRLYKPFTKHILTGNYPHPLITPKIISYSGYHELAYLHPGRFTPDKSVVKDLGLSDGQKYVIMRFVSWIASHDIGHKGISLDNKIRAIREFELYAKVFISSESALPKELEKYRIPISAERIHDAIAFAWLLYGESSTMAEEAAMLGTPAVYLYTGSTHYTTHLEKDYGLLFNYSESDEDQLLSINKGVELLSNTNTKKVWLERRDQMLKEKINVTDFLVWFVENYPDSVRVMKESPEFQYNFK